MGTEKSKRLNLANIQKPVVQIEGKRFTQANFQNSVVQIESMPQKMRQKSSFE